MMDNLLSEYEKFKNKTYDLSIIEFELIQAKLNLCQTLSVEQMKLFEEYEKLSINYYSKKESRFIQFAVGNVNIKQK